ncbi:malate synthase G [Vibrio sp. SS-MA-C1-2]|uniref:malate synthase G n=1 Tax=Vibrio sp. SS-MA-C1-2 TaxID=2908646 RepID=UPI001F342588|nr:malate synthase G [Vibrio sp. SS-MA-C1-2]UJF20136.1 malate synthase G [Vibrio sp. SS-MA-C1-2]
MNNYIDAFDIKVDQNLFSFVENEVLPGLQVESEQFWCGFSNTIKELAPKNAELLATRDRFQKQLDEWHIAHQSQPFDFSEYKSFLTEIGYLVEEKDAFSIATKDIDPEVAVVAGPQLILPISNARFALNATNARWGSLYNSLYGSDAVTGALPSGKGLDIEKANAVIQWGAEFLDDAIPLTSGSHQDVQVYELCQKEGQHFVLCHLANGDIVDLKDSSQFVGFNTSPILSLLFINNGLHIEVQIDATTPIGQLCNAGIKDVIVEAAQTTIMDFEDSVAAVDAEDKVQAYRNWLDLMKGTLTAEFEKGGKTVTRTIAKDRSYQQPNGEALTLRGRSLLLVRNVGHLMKTNMILDKQGNEIPEGIADAFLTSLCALHERTEEGLINSRFGSIYIVKPKMHGPEESAFTNTLFSCVEETLNLAPATLKVGVMDEERRTSANLKEVIRSVKDRLFFINTGFLDRTGDEIHTSMHAGAVYPKDLIKAQGWIQSYEARNVKIGLDCQLDGTAQIGKGMWAMPDAMQEMLTQKIGHPKAGANCAWVPSPLAAFIHATHYHRCDVKEVQQQIKSATYDYTESLDSLLTPPIMENKDLDSATIAQEIENNAQGILGYVVRWVNQGVGCSKVPDIHDIALMEDRATLRISSQILANWLLHGVCSEQQVMETMKQMAVVVDKQNANDPEYTNMAPDFDNSIAFKAACDLVFKGGEQPSGYTEPLLHGARQQFKASITKPELLAES